MIEPTTEVVETIEFDEAEPGIELPDPPEYHTLLEVWRAVLAPARLDSALRDPITPQWATRIIGTYPCITYADLSFVNTLLYELVDELGEILDAEIASDPECLTRTEVALDAEENAHHYRNLLRDWQLFFLQRELEWDPDHHSAAGTIAAMSEVHKMFFGDTGLTAHLEAIKFQYTEDDQAELHQALVEYRDSFLAALKEAASV